MLEKVSGPAPAGAVKRPAPPPGNRIEIGYVLRLPAPPATADLEVGVFQRLVPAIGRTEKWERMPVSAGRVERCDDPADRAILTALREATARTATQGLVAEGDRAPSIFAL